MSELFGLEWREPLWGLLALQPLLLWGLGYWRRHKLAGYADAALAPWALLAGGARPMERWRLLGHALAWALLAAAAAGPRLPLEESAGGGQPGQRHPLRVDIVLDVSASMQATDIAPSRLARAKLELRDLIARLRGERVGLIVYAGEPGLLSPATDDAALLQRMLDQVEPALIATPGTNLAAALQLAQRDVGQGGAVLLVGDAEADSLAGAAGEAVRVAVQDLKAAGIPLYVLGVGTASGAPIPLPEGGHAEQDGAQVLSRMAATSYGELAQRTGGVFVPAVDGDADWASLYDNHLARLPAAPPPADAVRAWRELYAWCLAPALVLLLWLHLPRALPQAAALLVAGLIALPAHDAQADDTLQAAWRDYRAGRHAEAQTRFERAGGYLGQLGAGAAAWRLKDYAAAQRHFGAALLLARTAAERSDALYNLGNAHYALGNWLAAAEAYQAVLRERPQDRRAQANLERAIYRLKQRRGPVLGSTDLRGRMGFFAEGITSTEWDREIAVKEFERKETGTLIDKDKAAGQGARLDGAASRAVGVEADGRRLQSGLKKLELLHDKPTAMYQGLMKQDASSSSMELPPW
ncbi:Ca-activated chloride channel family protein [Sulfuritortus calidifontis]|uniref:Ca-activated chloride channel family protein n=1 Tax=Sulfuritortus calidifontis TaxID=1914471 RepID=A0A4R3K0G1_9PROT|nr:VWA domain-containing protein [Sulfuritortus calidifontis]TCS73096.1 Ca-activated chloride channel family protein [Sulfuritortus calidifontis]